MSLWNACRICFSKPASTLSVLFFCSLFFNQVSQTVYPGFFSKTSFDFKPAEWKVLIYFTVKFIEKTTIYPNKCFKSNLSGIRKWVKYFSVQIFHSHSNVYNFIFLILHIGFKYRKASRCNSNRVISFFVNWIVDVRVYFKIPISNKAKIEWLHKWSNPMQWRWSSESKQRI